MISSFLECADLSALFMRRKQPVKKEKAATSRRTPNRRPSKLHDFWSALTCQRFSCGESNQRKKEKAATSRRTPNRRPSKLHDFLECAALSALFMRRKRPA